ncbi:hypothetical protein GCM10025875_23340 [Litorihabitans aurantiacus]|uniref:DUF305 domain-containing protein n=1 Tax=Litorihabitans aurantiacus TaxID=1930061 RepID=A0AA37XFJ6_9MICO|nr:hypothetical protein GCM10025875_23340 [Litorihabitans aurantiacus]
MDHGGMDHGGMGADSGMLSEEELGALADATGADADRLFLEGMIAHHEGAVAMAQDEVDGGRDADAIALAQEIITAQEEEITTMNDLLATLDPARS